MNRVLALTTDIEFFQDVENILAKMNSIEIKSFTESLDLIDYFLDQYAHLVILDIDILKENVIKMIHVLRSIHKDVKIILIFTKEYMSFCSAALSLGLISYQIKPISVNNTSEIIGSVLHIPIDKNQKQ